MKTEAATAPTPRTWTDAHVNAAVTEMQAAATYWAKPRKASRKARK